MDSPNAAKLFRQQESRVMRVAHGAGVQPADVENLITQYKKFSDLVKQMGGVKVRKEKRKKKTESEREISAQTGFYVNRPFSTNNRQ